MRRSYSLVAVVVAAACFSTIAILTSRVYDSGVRPLPLLAWRFALVAALMAGVQALRAPRALLVTPGDLGRFALLALVGYGAASVCFFFGLQQLKAAGNAAAASIVAVLLFTYPAMVVLSGSLFLGERLTAARMAAVAVTFGGCALLLGLLGARVKVDLAGFLLGLGSAVGYAVFNVLSDLWMRNRSRTVLMTYMFGISAIGTGTLALLRGESLSAASWSVEVWVLMAAIVLVPTFLAVLLYLEGVRGLGASQAAIISTFEPLFTIALAAVLLGERLTSEQWLGAGLVMGGVVLAEWGGGGRRASEVAAV